MTKTKEQQNVNKLCKVVRKLSISFNKGGIYLLRTCGNGRKIINNVHNKLNYFRPELNLRKCKRVGERERETQRQTDRQTDRQRDRQTDRQIWRREEEKENSSGC